MSFGLIGVISAGIGFLASVAFTGGIEGWTMFIVAISVATALTVLTDKYPSE